MKWKLPISLTDVFTSGFAVSSNSERFGAAQEGSPLPLFKPDDIHGRQSVLFVIVEEKQVKSDNIVDYEGNWVNGSRLDQREVSVLHKHHNCAWRLSG